MNSVKTENYAVVVLADRTTACSMIGYHSNSWASCNTQYTWVELRSGYIHCVSKKSSPLWLSW